MVEKKKVEQQIQRMRERKKNVKRKWNKKKRNPER